MFDLNSLAFTETSALHLRHPVTDELLFADKEQEKPVVINLYGPSSKQYRNSLTAMQNRHLRRAQKKETASAEDMRKEGIELLVACSGSSENLAIDGAAVTTAQDFRDMYSNPKFGWIKDQVDAHLGDTSNFLGQ